ncbi:hypothetical protein EGP95_03830 [bacterium]|nr:hypothetical protein [bacterium]
MKKTTILIIVVLFMVIGYAAYNTTINIYGNGKLAENLSDFKVYLSNLKVNGKEVSGINNTKDEFTINDINGDISVDIVNDSTEYDTEAYLECVKEDENVGKVWDYDYTGGEQTFIAPTTGTYKLETWGAQGGNYDTIKVGGYGAYSSGNKKITQTDKLYINVGGQGTVSQGGYNGGGSTDYSGGGGGGATHIALESGKLSILENKKNYILIVSGGGGGSGAFNNYVGGSGGGYIGEKAAGSSPGFGGTQLSGGEVSNYTGPTSTSGIKGSFGQGGNGGHEIAYKQGSGAGGSGFFGGSGGGARDGGGGGGSGYIGNSLLNEKTMYCYNCTESNETSTKTISTTCTSATPTANCAKQSNGYARITLISAPTNITTDNVTIIAQESTSQNIKSVSSKSITCKLKLNKISRTEKAYDGPTEWTFDYTGGEQTFTAPVNGTYKLEVWGAQGYTINSYMGGYGGYSTGKIIFSKNQEIYLFVGEKGKGGLANNTRYSSYPNSLNAIAGDNVSYIGSGGGSTHIALENSLISQITKLEKLIIVSGGGGASTWTSGNYWSGTGGSGGGFKGNSGQSNTSYFLPGGGGTQNSGGNSGSNGTAGNFGLSELTNPSGSCGGGGYYGGGTSWGSAGGGGSGYIGNTLLTEKSMYCYNCQESSEESTKTISTTCTSATPTANCAKQGNGYAKITLISLH